MRIFALILIASLVAADDGPWRPAFKSTLCQGWDKNSLPEGATDRFFADSPTVRIVCATEMAPPAGHTLTFSLVEEGKDGVREVQRSVSATDGASDTFGCGFYLSGRAWAQQGGKFRMRVFWDDEAEPFHEAPFTVSLGNRWALLAGISDYPPAGAGGQDLPACAQDAERMKALLVDSFGFPEDHITLLRNLEVTSDRVARELTALADKAGPDDAVFVYYSGHGTQIPDLDGDEADGWDEALATADEFPALVTTAEELKLFLSDDRIAQLLARFKTRNVTVIFDCCHSGTAVRAGKTEEQDLAVPGLAKGLRKDIGVSRKLLEWAAEADRSHPTGADGVDVDQRYVFLAGARSWETGQTGPDGCFFSEFLREALRTTNGESWEAIVNRVRPYVQARNPGQSPSATGAARRYPFSLAEAPADEPYVRPTLAVVGGFHPGGDGIIKMGAAKGQIALLCGERSLYLESKGVVCDVYPQSDTELKGPPKGRVTLTGTKQTYRFEGSEREESESSATVDEGEVMRGDRLVPRTVRVPGARARIGVGFVTGTAQDVLQRLTAIAQAICGLLAAERSLTVEEGDASQADYVLVPTMQDGTVLALVVTPQCQIVGNCAGSPEEIANGVRDLVVHRHSEFTRINRISNPSPPFRLRVLLDGGEGLRAPGEKLSCRGISEAPACLAAFAAMEGTGLTLVASSKGPVGPNTPFTFEVPTAAGATGRMVLRVFATTKPLDVAAIAKAPADGRADVLLSELRKACPSSAGDEFLGTDGWAAESLWVEFR